MCEVKIDKYDRPIKKGEKRPQKKDKVNYCCSKVVYKLNKGRVK